MSEDQGHEYDDFTEGEVRVQIETLELEVCDRGSRDRVLVMTVLYSRHWVGWAFSSCV